MFSLNHSHLFIRDMDIYFTKTNIMDCIAKYNFGEIYDCSILPGTTKFTNNVIIYIKKWGRGEYPVAAKTRLSNGQSIKIYYNNMDCWKATSYDPTKQVALKLKIANNIAEIIRFGQMHIDTNTNSNTNTNTNSNTNTNTNSNTNTNTNITLPHCEDTLRNSYIEINYGDCHKILPPRRRVCKKKVSN